MNIRQFLDKLNGTQDALIGRRDSAPAPDGDRYVCAECDGPIIGVEVDEMHTHPNGEDVHAGCCPGCHATSPTLIDELELLAGEVDDDQADVIHRAITALTPNDEP